MEKVCKLCGKIFNCKNKRQEYCSPACKEKVHTETRREKEEAKRIHMNKEKMCERKGCKFYQEHWGNNCSILIEVKKDNSKCSFFKER